MQYSLLARTASFLYTPEVVSKSLIRLWCNTSPNVLRNITLTSKNGLNLTRNLCRDRCRGEIRCFERARGNGLFLCPGFARQECYDALPAGPPVQKNRDCLRPASSLWSRSLRRTQLCMRSQHLSPMLTLYHTGAHIQVNIYVNMRILFKKAIHLSTFVRVDTVLYWH